jgi:hypothetical protein
MLAVNEADLHPTRARFLTLCAADRYAEAEPMVSLVYADGSAPDGSEVVARGAFYEEWGDTVAAEDADAARTAYAQAEEWYAVFASWATAAGEGSARMLDVDRARQKRRELERPSW